jgi:hypothetical protein
VRAGFLRWRNLAAVAGAAGAGVAFVKHWAGAGTAAVLVGMGVVGGYAGLMLITSHTAAADYIAGSLAADLKDPLTTYDQTKGSAFFVAVEEVNDNVVLGTVSIQGNPPHGGSHVNANPNAPQWLETDAELRRMSVRLFLYLSLLVAFFPSDSACGLV